MENSYLWEDGGGRAVGNTRMGSEVSTIFYFLIGMVHIWDVSL